METANEEMSPQDEQAIEETAKNLEITKKGLGKKEKIVIASVLGGAGFLLIASGLMIFFGLRQTVNIGSDEPKVVNTATEETTNVNVEEEVTEEEEEEVTYDRDNDGLPDEEEETIWLTDPDLADTDRDGLSDYEEVREYNTDPTQSDTDKDTFLDGEEVQAGYNPLGEGLLE